MPPPATGPGRPFPTVLRVNRDSEIPLHRQLIEQIIVLIATGHFEPGDSLPPVRQLARQNGIHYNTVSRAYRELVKDGWLNRESGRALTVRSLDARLTSPHDLDGLIEMTLRLARECGYTTKDLARRLMERLASWPDHVLVVSTDAGIERLIESELQIGFTGRIETCSVDGLKDNQEIALGALVVTLLGGSAFVEPHLPSGCPLLEVSINDPGEALKAINDLKHPSMIGLVSVSPLFLQRASGTLAPALGDQHTLQTHLLEKTPCSMPATDLVLCDSLSFSRVSARRKFEYRLVSGESIQEICDTLSV